MVTLESATIKLSKPFKVMVWSRSPIWRATWATLDAASANYVGFYLESAEWCRAFGQWRLHILSMGIMGHCKFGQPWPFREQMFYSPTWSCWAWPKFNAFPTLVSMKVQRKLGGKHLELGCSKSICLTGTPLCEVRRNLVEAFASKAATVSVRSTNTRHCCFTIITRYHEYSRVPT